MIVAVLLSQILPICFVPSYLRHGQRVERAGEGGIEGMAMKLVGSLSTLRLWRCGAEETVWLARRRDIVRMARTAARFASLLDELMQRISLGRVATGWCSMDESSHDLGVNGELSSVVMISEGSGHS